MITPILGVITRKSGEDPGILFYEDNGDIYILEILPTSPFKSTELRPGMLVLSVNNIPCEEVTVEFVANILLETQGKVNILVHHDSTTMGPLDDARPTSSSSFETSPVCSISGRRIVNGTIVTDYDVEPVTRDILNSSDVETPQYSTRFIGIEPEPHAARPPPPGTEEGGAWGKVNVVGLKSWLLVAAGCLLVGPLWCLILCCAVDKATGYCVGGSVYDKRGNFVGYERDVVFIPDDESSA